MQDFKSFYTKQITAYKSDLSKIKKQLYASSMLRLLAFCFTILGVYFAFGNTRIVWAIIVVAIVLFVFLVSRHSDLQYKRDRLKALLKINQTEIDVIDRKFHHLSNGEEYKNPNHFYCQDIDLFGRGSFYQYANRTALKQGSEVFSLVLLENSIENILGKQEAIQELGKMPKWRQEFSAVASLTKTETSTKSITKWLGAYTPFIPGSMKYVPAVFSVASLAVITLYFLNLLPELALILWLVIGLGIVGIFTKKITKLASDTSKIQSTFEQYNKLLTILEETEFKSQILRKKRERVITNDQKTSKVLKEFSGLLSSLDQNNNVIYLVFGNGFFLRSLYTCFQIEKWIKAHSSAVEEWFNVIAFFDAYNSLGNFAFNHPKYSFPEISDNNITLKSSDAGHPLLDPKKSVVNDFEIDAEQFLIITGANMAGKSTFLRTVSLQIVMANVGLPVCASKAEYAPIKLITSMRTADSLTDDESYFFSELKRLKFIVDEIQKDRYFIVLDEILKGTNSTDKAKGSRKFVEKLVVSKSTGIIATHDLSLCEAADELPQVKNYFFDAEIIDDELHFDYKFKKGICQNMNASFLLKKMDIV
ncbi:MutS-related protein [Maribacter sp. HTCC2170]|uniref:MutS-related protein n=1 Tax=Maribacter sp. (strain HTCC2170 / KCCM 42371) TaxID=313603 RepID=UPI00006BD1DB|nr:DNA mismatch repair protein MutS [Maribacter sp. HTCC2170]EAR02324.1 DNA mismatch repair protein mutS [Maribacter sp. HTCC2170]